MQTDWLDGPGVVAWLEESGCTKRDLGDNGPLGMKSKRIREWRKGTKVNVYVLDEVLVRLGFSIFLLPDELYVEAPAVGKVAGKPCLTERETKEIKELADAPRGYRSQLYCEIAERYGISERRVRQIVTGN